MRRLLLMASLKCQSQSFWHTAHQHTRLHFDQGHHGSKLPAHGCKFQANKASAQDGEVLALPHRPADGCSLLDGP